MIDNGDPIFFIYYLFCLSSDSSELKIVQIIQLVCLVLRFEFLNYFRTLSIAVIKAAANCSEIRNSPPYRGNVLMF